MTRRPLKKGDVIFAQDVLYRHYGIYEGDGKVIDFSSSKGHETDASDACIREKSLSAFAKGRECSVDDSVEQKFSPTETVYAGHALSWGRKKANITLPQTIASTLHVNVSLASRNQNKCRKLSLVLLWQRA